MNILRAERESDNWALGESGGGGESQGSQDSIIQADRRGNIPMIGQREPEIYSEYGKLEKSIFFSGNSPKCEWVDGGIKILNFC